MIYIYRFDDDSVKSMAIEQIRVGADNFCYVIYDDKKHVAAVVDPGFDTTPTTLFLESLNLDVVYIIATHYHSDHTSEIGTLKKRFPKAKVVASAEDGKRLFDGFDMSVRDGDKLFVGEVMLRFLETPGHTPGGLCILVDETALITGDTLFIGNCGRTDLPGGNLEKMFSSLQKKILPLSDHIMIYPGHDYGDQPFDMLGHQKKTNKTLRAKSLSEFAQIP
jgi:hydroxyacylglutathione hydrolase